MGFGTEDDFSFKYLFTERTETDRPLWGSFKYVCRKMETNNFISLDFPVSPRMSSVMQIFLYGRIKGNRSRKLCTYVKYLKRGIIFIRKNMVYYMSLKIKKIRGFTVPFSYLF